MKVAILVLVAVCIAIAALAFVPVKSIATKVCVETGEEHETAKAIWSSTPIAFEHSTSYSAWIKTLDYDPVTTKTWVLAEVRSYNVFGYTVSSTYEQGMDYIFCYHAIMEKKLSKSESCALVNEVRNTPSDRLADLFQILSDQPTSPNPNPAP
jgi:hypothetical protein